MNHADFIRSLIKENTPWVREIADYNVRLITVAGILDAVSSLLDEHYKDTLDSLEQLMRDYS